MSISISYIVLCDWRWIYSIRSIGSNGNKSSCL
jgi:hypothetical protein